MVSTALATAVQSVDQRIARVAPFATFVLQILTNNPNPSERQINAQAAFFIHAEKGHGDMTYVAQMLCVSFEEMILSSASAARTGHEAQSLVQCYTDAKQTGYVAERIKAYQTFQSHLQTLEKHCETLGVKICKRSLNVELPEIESPKL